MVTSYRQTETKGGYLIRILGIAAVFSVALGLFYIGHQFKASCGMALAKDNEVLVDVDPGDRNDGIRFAYNPDTHEVFAVQQR